jgi:hypothetical protein
MPPVEEEAQPQLREDSPWASLAAAKPAIASYMASAQSRPWSPPIRARQSRALGLGLT